MAEFLNGWGYGRTLLVLDETDRGDPEVGAKYTRVSSCEWSPAFSVRDMLNADKIVMTEAAVEKIAGGSCENERSVYDNQAASDYGEEHESVRSRESTRSRLK